MRAFLIAPVAIGIALGLGASSIAGIVLFALAGIALATGATGVFTRSRRGQASDQASKRPPGRHRAL